MKNIFSIIILIVFVGCKTTPLIEAASQGNKDEVKKLISMKSDVNESCCMGDYTPLMVAAGNGHLDVVKILVESGASVTQGNSLNITALHSASISGHVEVVKYLISKDAQIDAIERNRYSTPLHWAVEYEHIEVVKILLKAKADPNLRRRNPDVTALGMANHIRDNNVNKINELKKVIEDAGGKM
jgi:ankyrin repeat protein